MEKMTVIEEAAIIGSRQALACKNRVEEMIPMLFDTLKTDIPGWEQKVDFEDAAKSKVAAWI